VALIRLFRDVDVRPSTPDEWVYESRASGKDLFYLFVSREQLESEVPVRMDRTTAGGRPIWLVEGRVYIAEDDLLTPADVRALANEVQNRRRLTLEKAHALQAMADRSNSVNRRSSIPRSVRLEVWQRDGGRCVECDSQERLEFDHVIPVALGGANTARNLQLLCERCNRRKGATLG
jgi:hypothetical protein